ncbi:hypothetical protein I6E29_07915 [Arcanobacterium haemolyticum]|nr:hypothetical protein [Arcanobacterium haemolyticum]
MEIGEVGQLISQRYQLTSQFPVQISGASAWTAIDTYRSFNVRLILLDPTMATTADALDAARRAALFNSARTVRVLSVSENDESPAWICTEIPLGEPLADAYTGMPFPPEQIHAVTGEVATILNEARERGIRHLQINPRTVRVDVAGEVFVDGFGYLAALAGIPTQGVLMGTELDRSEAHGVIGLAASMLVGDPDVDPEAAIAEGAGDPDLDEQLRLVFSREAEGLGSLSPAELVRELAPWPRVSPHQFPHTQAKFGWEPPAFESTAAAPVRPEWPMDDEVNSVDPDDGDDILTMDDEEPQSVSLREQPAAVEDAGDDDEVGSVDAEASADVPSAATPDLSGDDPEPEPGDDELSGDEDAARDSSVADVAPHLDVELGISPAPKVMVTPQWQTPDEFAAEAAEHEAHVERERAEAEGAEAVMLIEADETEADNPTAVIDAVTAEQAEESAIPMDNIVAGEPDDEPHPREDMATVQPAEETPEPDTPTLATSEPTTSEAPEPEPIVAPHTSEPKPTTQKTHDTTEETTATHNSSRDTTTPQPGPHSRPAIAVTGPINKKNRSLSWIFTTGAIVLVCVAAAWALLTFFAPTKEVELSKPRLTAEPTAQATESASATPSSTPTTETLPAPTLSSITLLNPQGDLLDPATVAEQDSPSTVVNAIDGNPATSWRSWWYTNENFVRKEGIGLEIKLAAKAKVNEVDLQVNGQGGNVQWRNTTSATPNAGDVLAESAMSSATVLKAAEAQGTDTIILWFNSLPTDPEGNYRIDLVDITVK